MSESSPPHSMVARSMLKSRIERSMLFKTVVVVAELASTERLTDMALSPFPIDAAEVVPLGLRDSGIQLETTNNLFKLARRASSFLKVGRASGITRRAEQLLISWLAAANSSAVLALLYILLSSL